ncbi:MAG: hypothetical protein QY307_11375 [Acidimicrobiia bacterium]|nr:MAG: hypothetical protein QY307_11375 [Acidimicrobiia bacterium]
MRRYWMILLVLALAACGDDAATTTTEAAATTTTEAAATTTTEAAATTTTEAAAATTTGVDATAERVAVAATYAGTYTGEWNNTTFGSTGPVDVAVTVDDVAASTLISIDLGGNVFGGSNPDPFVVELDLVMPSPYTGSTPLLGDYSVEFGSEGGLVITAPSVPGLGGLMLVVEGTLDPEGFSLEYTMLQEGGPVYAAGVLTVAPTE